MRYLLLEDNLLVYLLRLLTNSFYRVTQTPLDIVPDVNDPNFYCKSCDRHYGSLAKFRKHLKKTHKHQLEVPPLESGRRLRVRPDILPDVDDPNWYCKSCQRHFKTHDIYRKHIKRIHEIPLKRLAPPLLYDPTIEPEIDNPDNFCRSCKKTMKNSSNYRRHLVVVHKMKLERLPKSKHDRSIQPDIDDPNFFCKSCNKSFEDRGRYRIHVQHVHKIELQPLLTHPKYVPDMELTAADIKNDSTNTFCVICKLLFSHRDRYRHHMLKHKERGNKPIKGKSKINPNIVPDVDDPDFHCKSCDYKFSCKSGYRSHLRKIHEMNLPSLL